MRRVSHDTWSAIIGVAYLGLMTNLLLLASALPTVLLLITTDPAYSWPFILAAVALSAPGVAAAFAVFRAHGRGDAAIVRAFVTGWRATWRKALVVGVAIAGIIAVVLVDVRVVAPLPVGVVLVPVLGTLALLALSTALIALVAVAEAPAARLRDVLKASLYLGVRRWYLSAVSLLVLGMQLALFAAMPAIAVGLSAAPALYVAWANARYTLRPVLATDDATV